MSRNDHEEMTEAELPSSQRQDFADLETKIDRLSASVAQIVSQGEVSSATQRADPTQQGATNDDTSGFP